MILVSACLVGCKCRYDGKDNTSKILENYFLEGKLLPICPEVLGSLPVPRPSCEIIQDGNGNQLVMTYEGFDVTDAFQCGAQRSLNIALAAGCQVAILKRKSPSCGYGQIYDGSFNRVLTEGNGLTADLLASHGIKIYNEDNFELD